MEITKEVLNNLKLKRGKLSEKRCQEINQMKIKNPYYPMAYFSQEDCEYFIVENENNLYSTTDERIVFIHAFYPMPILRRESEVVYDDIYLLIIDDECYEIIFDYTETKVEKINGVKYCRYTVNLRENTCIDERKDIKEIIFLLEEIEIERYRFFKLKNEEYELNIKYKGERYPWRNWKEL